MEVDLVDLMRVDFVGVDFMGMNQILYLLKVLDLLFTLTDVKCMRFCRNMVWRYPNTWY